MNEDADMKADLRKILLIYAPKPAVETTMDTLGSVMHSFQASEVVRLMQKWLAAV